MSRNRSFVAWKSGDCEWSALGQNLLGATHGHVWLCKNGKPSLDACQGQLDLIDGLPAFGTKLAEMLPQGALEVFTLPVRMFVVPYQQLGGVIVKGIDNEMVNLASEAARLDVNFITQSSYLLVVVTKHVRLLSNDRKSLNRAEKNRHDGQGKLGHSVLRDARSCFGLAIARKAGSWKMDQRRGQRRFQETPRGHRLGKVKRQF